MRRRHFLGALLTAGTAGCLQFEGGTDSAREGTATGGVTATSTGGDGSTRTATGTEAPAPPAVTLDSRWDVATPVIDQMTVHGENVVLKTHDRLRCLDVETGATNWEALADVGTYSDQLHSDGESIFYFAGAQDDQRLYVLDSADGAVRGSVSHEFNPGDEPILTDDDVIFATFDGENDENRLYAVDRDSLETRWTTTAEETKTGISSGIVADGTIHVGFNNSLRGFSLADGALEYRSPLGVETPVAFEDGFVAPVLRDGRTFARIGVPSLSIDWELDREAVGTPEIDGSRVFSRTRDGVLAVDGSDGTERWHHTIEGRSGHSPVWRPSFQDGVLWVVGPDGALHGYDGQSGEEVLNLGDGDVESAAATDHGLVVRTAGGVTGYAIELE
jgi:outer membrane protein assembly factor BamB